MDNEYSYQVLTDLRVSDLDAKGQASMTEMIEAFLATDVGSDLQVDLWKKHGGNRADMVASIKNLLESGRAAVVVYPCNNLFTIMPTDQARNLKDDFFSS